MQLARTFLSLTYLLLQPHGLTNGTVLNFVVVQTPGCKSGSQSLSVSRPDVVRLPDLALDYYCQSNKYIWFSM